MTVQPKGAKAVMPQTGDEAGILGQLIAALGLTSLAGGFVSRRRQGKHIRK